MDIAMTKGFAASTDTISIDANSDDKEILEIVKTANLDAKTLKSLIYNFSENTPKDTLSAEDKEILQIIKKENLDLQKFKHLIALSKARGIDEDSRPVVKKILDFMKKENLQIKDFEERCNLPRTAIRKFIYATRSENMSLYSMVKIADVVNFSLDELVLDVKTPIKREKNLSIQEIREYLILKIKNFLETNQMSKLNFETKANICKGTIVRLFSTPNNLLRISSLTSIAKIMQCSLEDFLPPQKN